MPKPLEGYVEVHERITAFYEKFPQGSLQGTYHIQPMGDETFLVYRAEAFRSGDDQRPAVGYAWEPYPGKTNFTRDSELMNAETSAWGRAIAALGFEVNRGIASKQEVLNRQGSESRGGPPKGFASDPQRDLFVRELKKAGASEEEVVLIKDWADATLTGERNGGISKAIDGLKAGTPEVLGRALDAATTWAAKQSAVPGDDADLPTVDEALAQDDEPKLIGG